MKKIIMLMLTCISGLAANAQPSQPDPDTTAKHFLIVASIGNLQEAGAGQLAVQKGKRAEVRAFGQMMMKDHSEAEQKLLALANTRGYSLPGAATGGIRPDPALKNATNAFDRLYVHAMVTAHRNTLHTFENYAVTGKDPAVRAFAQQMLPVLKHHLEEIERIDAQIKNKAD